MADEKFPHDALAAAGYSAAVYGQKTYNGVALLLRQPLAAEDVTRGISGFADDNARLIAATVPAPGGPLRLVNGYFVNGQEPGCDKFDYKMRWLTALHGWLQAELARHPRLALVGDFNIVSEDRDSHDPVGLAGAILHTPEERAHFRGLLNLGLQDAFRLFEQPPQSFSWWDYRVTQDTVKYVEVASKVVIAGFIDINIVVDGLFIAMNIYGDKSVETMNLYADMMLNAQNLGKLNCSVTKKFVA